MRSPIAVSSISTCRRRRWRYSRPCGPPERDEETRDAARLSQRKQVCSVCANSIRRKQVCEAHEKRYLQQGFAAKPVKILRRAHHPNDRSRNTQDARAEIRCKERARRGRHGLHTAHAAARPIEIAPQDPEDMIAACRG